MTRHDPPLAVVPPVPVPEVAVRDSEIDGRGAFALAPLPARRRIGTLDGEIVSIRTGRRRARSAERVQMVELDDSIALDASHGSSPLRFVNHSCRPNTYMRIAPDHRVEFYALRDIRAGEELTARYGPTHHGGALRCRCGIPGCKRWL